MSTFVAVVVMSASTSYVFRVFFIQFFGICIFGMAARTQRPPPSPPPAVPE